MGVTMTSSYSFFKYVLLAHIFHCITIYSSYYVNIKHRYQCIEDGHFVSKFAIPMKYAG